MKKINSFAAILLASILLSCSGDFLNRAPLDEPTDDNFFASEADLIAAVNSAYNNTVYRESFGGGIPHLLMTDIATDVGWFRGGGGYVAFGNGNGNPNLGETFNFWRNYYQGIAKVNNLLDKMSRAQEAADPEVYARIEAEARFLRAYFYSNLAEMYGDVPLITTVLPLAEAEVARTPKAEVVTFILAELDAIADALPEEYSGNEKGRATKGAALGLKSRVALYNEEYSEAAEAAKAVMDLQEYSLYPDYRNLFTYEGEGSEEVIFSRGYLKAYETHGVYQMNNMQIAGGWAELIPTRALVDSYEVTDGMLIDESPNYDPKEPYDNRDPRLRQTIVAAGDTWMGIQIETHPDSLVVTNYTLGTRITNISVTNQFSTYSGFAWKKYMDEADKPASQQSEIDFIIMRYAEILLNYAEARIEMNSIDQSVLDAINAIRQRPTVMMPIITTMDQSELRTIVRRERKIELAGEGLRLFDIRRWGIAEKALDGTLVGRPIKEYYLDPPIPQIDEDGIPDYTPHLDLFRVIEPRHFDASRDYLWPIPQRERDINKNLEQNPNY